MKRLKAFLGTLIYSVIAIVFGALLLTGGYWLSDVLYDAGLWPLGAILRVALLFLVFSLGITLLVFVFSTLRILFVADWDD